MAEDQEKKLDTLLNDPKSKKIKNRNFEKMDKGNQEDIEKTRNELGAKNKAIL